MQIISLIFVRLTNYYYLCVCRLVGCHENPQKTNRTSAAGPQFVLATATQLYTRNYKFCTLLLIVTSSQVQNRYHHRLGKVRTASKHGTTHTQSDDYDDDIEDGGLLTCKIEKKIGIRNKVSYGEDIVGGWVGETQGCICLSIRNVRARSRKLSCHFIK